MKNNNKRGATMLGIIVGFVAIGLFALATSQLVTHFNNEFGGYDTSLTEGYDNTDAFINQTREMQQQINSNNTGTLDTIAYTTRGSISVMSLGMNTIDMVGKTFTRISQSLGIDITYVQVAIAIVFLMLIMIFISALVRYNLGAG